MKQTGGVATQQTFARYRGEHANTAVASNASSGQQHGMRDVTLCCAERERRELLRSYMMLRTGGDEMRAARAVIALNNIGASGARH